MSPAERRVGGGCHSGQGWAASSANWGVVMVAARNCDVLIRSGSRLFKLLVYTGIRHASFEKFMRAMSENQLSDRDIDTGR